MKFSLLSQVCSDTLLLFCPPGINREGYNPKTCWSRTIETNLTGTFLTIKYAVPHLKKQGGAIVVTASVNGTRVFSNTGATAYSVTKAGQVAMTKMLAVELARSNIRVNVICPGATKTEIGENTEKQDVDRIQFPVEYPKGSIPLGDGKPATAAQVGELVLFLAQTRQVILPEQKSGLTELLLW